MDYSRSELADRLAADYVSGTLRGAARRRLEALLPAHPVLRDAVHEWQDRLAPLSASINPQAPPPAVWTQIEARIDGRGERVTRSRHWWQGVAFWRSASAFSTVAAVSAMLLLANPVSIPAPIIVVLNAPPPAGGGGAGEAPTASFVASISGDGRAVVTRPLVSPPPGRREARDCGRRRWWTRQGGVRARSRCRRVRRPPR